MIDSMSIDPTPLWVAVGLSFGLLAVYLRAFSRRHYPSWSWLAFLALAALIFVSTNGGRVQDSTVGLALDLVALLTIVGCGAVLFWLSTIYVQLADT